MDLMNLESNLNYLMNLESNLNFERLLGHHLIFKTMDLAVAFCIPFLRMSWPI